MAVRNLVILAGQSNMEGTAGQGSLKGLDSVLQGAQVSKVWNQRRGTETARPITAVTFDANRWVTITCSPDHGCVYPPARRVPVTIANNTGAGGAAINGQYNGYVVGALEGTPILNRITIDFSANPRSGSPVVDGEIYVGGPGDWEALNADAGVHNNHSEWPLPTPGYFGVEMRIGYLLNIRYGAAPYLLKLSPSGSSLAPGHGSGVESAKTSWHPDESGDQWYEIWQRIYDAAKNAFTADGDTLKARALFWIQGEADATDDHSSRAYDGNWRRFLQAFRAKLAIAKASDLAAYGFDYTDPFPFVVCGIANDQNGLTSGDKLQRVRDALREVGIGDSSYHYFDAHGKPLWDGVHFDSREIDEIAYGMDTAYGATGGVEAELADEETFDVSTSAQLARVRQAIAETLEYGQSSSLTGTSWQGASIGELIRLEQLLTRREAAASGQHRTFARVGRVR